ncbi:hypothetical protein EON79_18110 [bacterium]|nr:MAG: hypothetical protein EON79_18110 [bacterium]
MTNAKLQKAVAVHDGKLFIKSPKVFHLEFPVTSEAVYYSDWMTYYEVADGKKFGRRRRGGWKDFSAVTSRPPLNKGGVLNTWVIQGPSRVLGSIGTDHAPLAALLREARAAKAKVTVERSSGTPIPMERLKIVRKGDGKKILPIDLEIVAEPNRGLPLSMFTIGFDKRKKSVALRWAAKWNMNPKQDFQTEYFTFKQ